MRREFSLFDDEGFLVKKSTSFEDNLKEGWLVMYKEPLRKLISESKEYSKVKVFIYLSSLQTYDSLVFTTITSISKNLKMTYKTCWACIKWLEEKQYLKRVERDGMHGFLLNPKITTCGKKSLKEKNALWSMNFSDFQRIDKDTGEILLDNPSDEVQLEMNFDDFDDEVMNNEH